MSAGSTPIYAFYSFWHSEYRGGRISILTMNTEEWEYGILNGYKNAGGKGVQSDVETYCYIYVYPLAIL